MRGIPFAYSLRNLWTRRLTTILTISGMALVVFVFTTILMLAQGLQKTLVETGSYDNAVIIRKGSGSEVQSWVDRAQAGIIETDPLVASGSDGKPLVATGACRSYRASEERYREGVKRNNPRHKRSLSRPASAGRSDAGQNAEDGFIGGNCRIERRAAVQRSRSRRRTSLRNAAMDNCRDL